MRQIIVIVDSDGNVKIEAVGYKGPACTKATQALEEALGMVKSRDKRPDYYVEEVRKASVGR